jgi:hypothetical protein
MPTIQAIIQAAPIRVVISGAQGPRGRDATSEVVDSNTEAAFDYQYNVVANAVISDPDTPIEGKSYNVFVIAGTATVGGVAYSQEGSMIRRYYEDGEWRSKLYRDSTAYATAAQGALADSAVQPSDLGSAAYADTTDFATAAQGTDERVPTAAGLTSKFSTAKATPVDNDRVAIFDSAASNAPKHTLWSSVKSTLKSYFDTVYAAIVHTHVAANITDFAEAVAEAAPNSVTSATTSDGTCDLLVASLSVYPNGGLSLVSSNSGGVVVLNGQQATDARIIAFPDASGTVALTSDITNSVTSATTSDGTAELSLRSATISDGGGKSIALNENGTIALIDIDASSEAALTSDSLSFVFAENSIAVTASGILTNRSYTSENQITLDNAYFDSTGFYTAAGSDSSQVTPTSVSTGGTLGLSNGTHATTLSHAPTGNRAIAFPDASGTVALTTSNVSTATALQTSRNIFGIAFNGTGNVTGDAVTTGHFASIPTGGTAGHFVTLNGTAPTVAAGRSVWWSDASGAPSFRNGTGGAVTLVRSSDLGTGVATFLATPTSANLAAAVTDETGSGSLVFATSPTITTPTIAQINTPSNTTTLLISGGGTNGLFGLRSTLATGFSSMELLNSGGTQTGGFGYGNASASAYADQVYFYSAGKVLILATSAGQRHLIIDTSGRIGIGNGISTVNAAAQLQVDSTTRGFLPPRMTTAQRDAITSVPAGLMIYNTSTNKLNFFNGSAWEAVTSA